VSAQTSFELDKTLSISKLKARAEEAEKSGDIYSALFYYEEVVRKNPEDIAAWFETADLYRLTRNYKKAEEAYNLVYSKSPGAYPFALYYKGVMQKMNGKYEEAEVSLLAFKKKEQNVGDKDFKKLLAREIAGCDSGLVYQQFPDNVKIENAGNSVNQPHAEFSPVIIDSTNMLFGALRMETVKYFDITEENKEVQPSRQVYKAEKINGKWEDKGKFEVVNDPEMDMGNVVYSSVSGKYFFTKCTKIKGKNSCKIYFTEKVNGEYIKPVLLPSPVNLEGYTSTQPAVVLDSTGKREILYFVSDRPEGKGGLDIWYSSYNSKKKEWSEPTNFSFINTSESEMTPFYHVPAQTFYFSSNGHVSAGGLDVYKTKRVNGRYTKPENLSFPINSPQDDLDFKLDKNGKNGFVVSNRPGGTPFFHETCCDDIYAFTIYPSQPFICTLDLSIVAPDTADSNNMMLKLIASDVKSGKDTVYKINVKDGNFKFQLEKNHRYSFTVDKDGFRKDTLTIVTRDMASTKVISKKFELRKENANDKAEQVTEKPVEDKPFVLRDIQYETNDTELNAEAKAALDSILIPFLKAHPKDKIFISSHTDDQGSHHYNKQLSQKRAENVVIYLKSKGIEVHRMHAKGHGETNPVAPNKNPDGSDNPMGRSLNRRTEFLIVKH
jgi:outer membrane protein OmpA-like peptidoglycan-associated protein